MHRLGEAQEVRKRGDVSTASEARDPSPRFSPMLHLNQTKKPAPMKWSGHKIPTTMITQL